ncbi:MAG: MFS transporter [Oscillospiraceae bacterium]|nr:MFS transporter [Oscillospiraceae bacterium]
MSDANTTPTTLQAPRKLTVWNKTFVCVLLAHSFLSLSQGAVNILIARYALESLKVSDVMMGNLIGLYFGVAFAMRPVTGPLQIRLNKRNLLIAVYFTGGVVNLGYALFTNTSAFIAFRVIQGIQYAFMGSLTMTIAVDSLPAEKVASGVAMYSLGGTVMQAIAPNVGLWLRDLGPLLKEGAEGITLGYQLAFYFGAIVLAVAVVPLLLISYKKDTKEEIAAAGAWYKNIVSLKALPMTLLIILSGIATSGYRSYIDAFAYEVGIPSIGLFSTVSAAVMLGTRPLCGRILDKYSMKLVQPIGMALLGISLVIIAGSRTLFVILIGAVISSIGNGVVSPGLQAMCVQTEPAKRRAVATNTLFAGVDLGMYVGPALGGFVVSRYSFSTTILSGLVPLALTLICFYIIYPGFMRRKKAVESMQ